MADAAAAYKPPEFPTAKPAYKPPEFPPKPAYKPPEIPAAFPPKPAYTKPLEVPSKPAFQRVPTTLDEPNADNIAKVQRDLNSLKSKLAFDGKSVGWKTYAFLTINLVAIILLVIAYFKWKAFIDSNGSDQDAAPAAIKLALAGLVCFGLLLVITAMYLMYLSVGFKA